MGADHIFSGNVEKKVMEITSGQGADVVKATAFLADLNDYSRFNEIYNSYFISDPPPVRTTVKAKMPFGALLEVEAITCKI